MRNFTINLALGVTVAGLVSAACGDSGPGRVPPAGGAGSTATGMAMGAPLVPDATGWVDGAANSAGVQGAWFGYNDCNDSPEECTTNHMVGGVPVMPDSAAGFPNMDGMMCTQGTTAVVNAEAEFSTKWGAGIALELASPGGAGAVPSPFDASAFTGFQLTLTNNGTNPVRVNLTNPDLLDSHYKELVVTGTYTVTFAEVRQGSWVTAPVDFQQDQILAIQFQVPSAMGTAVAFDYCISALSIY